MQGEHVHHHRKCPVGGSVLDYFGFLNVRWRGSNQRRVCSGYILGEGEDVMYTVSSEWSEIQTWFRCQALWSSLLICQSIIQENRHCFQNKPCVCCHSHLDVSLPLCVESSFIACSDLSSPSSVIQGPFLRLSRFCWLPCLPCSPWPPTFNRRVPGTFVSHCPVPFVYSPLSSHHECFAQKVPEVLCTAWHLARTCRICLFIPSPDVYEMPTVCRPLS